MQKQDTRLKHAYTLSTSQLDPSQHAHTMTRPYKTHHTPVKVLQHREHMKKCCSAQYSNRRPFYEASVWQTCALCRIRCAYVVTRFLQHQLLGQHCKLIQSATTTASRPGCFSAHASSLSIHLKRCAQTLQDYSGCPRNETYSIHNNCH